MGRLSEAIKSDLLMPSKQKTLKLRSNSLVEISHTILPDILELPSHALNDSNSGCRSDEQTKGKPVKVESISTKLLVQSVRLVLHERKKLHIEIA